MNDGLRERLIKLLYEMPADSPQKAEAIELYLEMTGNTGLDGVVQD